MAQFHQFMVDRETLEMLLDLPEGMTLRHSSLQIEGAEEQDAFTFSVDCDDMVIPDNAIARYAPNDIGSLTLVEFIKPE